MRKLSFILSEALRNLMHNKFMTLVVIVNISISLYFASVFMTSFLHLSRLIGDAEDRISLEVFLEDDKTDTAIVRSDIMATTGIASLRYISKQEARDIFVKEVGSEILNAVEGNPLPASFRCAILPEYRTPEKIAVIRNSLKGIKQVEDVSEMRGWVPLLQKVRRIFAAVSLVAISILSMTIFFTVFSTIRLAYQSRHEHIKVMSLVGASEFDIKMPFIIGGGIQGFCGGLLSVAALYITIHFARKFISGIVYDPRIPLILVITGFLLGTLASFRSIPTEERV